MDEGVKDKTGIYGSNTIKLHWDNHPSGGPSGIADALCGSKISSVP